MGIAELDQTGNRLQIRSAGIVRKSHRIRLHRDGSVGLRPLRRLERSHQEFAMDLFLRRSWRLDLRQVPHLKQLSQKKRAFFALGLSSIFVQGSLLLCALVNKMVGGNAMTHSAPRMILGASLAGGCIHLGKSYMDIVDGDYEEAAVEEDEVEEEGEE